jgi:hypothetical protein
MNKKTLVVVLAVSLLSILVPKAASAHHVPPGYIKAPGKVYGDHKRNTTYICEKNVTYKNSGTFSNGRRYQVVELSLHGNDNASIHYKELGSALPLSNRKCKSNNASIWGDDWKFHPDKVLAGSDKPIDIAIGGVKNKDETSNFCNFVISNEAKFMTGVLAIQCKLNGSQVAEINDLAAASINGKNLYCAGMPNKGHIKNFEGYPTCSSVKLPGLPVITAQQIHNTIANGMPHDYEGMPTAGFLDSATASSKHAKTINPSAYKYVSEASQPSLFSGGNYFGIKRNGSIVASFPVKTWAINTENGWGPFNTTPDGVVPTKDAHFKPRSLAKVFKEACGGDYKQCKSLKTTVRFTLIYNKKATHDADFTGSAGPTGGDVLDPYQYTNKVAPGKKYSVKIKAWNKGPKKGKLTELFVENENTSLASHSAIGPLSNQAYNGGVNSIIGSDKKYLENQNFCSENSDKPLYCWWWSVSNLPANKNPVYTDFTFKVDESAKQDDEFCFDVYIREKDGPSSQRKKACFKVDIPTKPTLRIKGGDAHAGARLSMTVGDPNCDNSTVTGNVQTHGGGNASYGEYAVSAHGSITGFRSEDDNPLSRNLIFNNDKPNKGGYKIICRPDLAKKVESVTGPEDSPSTINVDTLSSKAHVFKTGSKTINGSTIAASKRLTIVVKGDLKINGNIQYSPNYGNRGGIPALAVIATGNIHIAPGVTRLDGLYVSNQKIITCSDGTSAVLLNLKPKIAGTGSAKACNKPLTINGTVVANEIYFRRTYGNVGGSKVAETISSLPELYIAPPPLTGSLLNLTRENQLDLPPVF